MFPTDDTIAAIASAPGGAARGIVRISGPLTIAILKQCLEPVADQEPINSAHSPCVIVALIRRGGAAPLPADLFLWPASRSYTHAPVAEIHTLGSPPLLNELLRTLCAAGARLAQPGEFTLRAFLAGRIDLTQAEAVLGVVDAADRRQLDVALVQLAGGLARPLEHLRSNLLDLLADLEAGLDFAEEDIQFVSRDQLESRLAAAAKQIGDLTARLVARATISTLPRVVLVGPPNAGKSSLFNALVRQSAAIVSPQPGTTRDYLRATIDAAGLAVELVDTAGLADAAGAIEAAAQAHSAGQSRAADLRLRCHDTTVGTIPEPNAGELVVLTKWDLMDAAARSANAIATSSHTDFGLDRLRSAIRDALAGQASEAHAVAVTVARSQESIRLAGASIAEARRLAAASAGEELLAAELRVVLAELGKIAGAVYTDDLLDRIFSRFCIGK